MDREIKFRAVFHNTDIDEKVVSVNSYTVEELAGFNEHEWEFSDGGTLPANDVEDGELEYIQYTGHHDKNGKEIYEGDILNSLYSFEGCTGVYEIIWLNGGFYPARRKKHQQMGVTIYMSDLQRCEIIGNIYESPELLK